MGSEVLCVGQVADADQIDEIGYLRANPDVRGSGLNARTHYASFGQAEQRMQAINRPEVARMRESKLARVQFRGSPLVERRVGESANFLPLETVREFDIPDHPPESAHPYSPPVVQLIRDNRDKIFLDVGAGLRHIYYDNVLNTEVYPSVSTDVLCVGEALPFADAQFDFVFCFATLEHTKRPWDVAAEICRVLKPGGTVVVDYPFMQPVHGYPHHYFNATPSGNRSLFEKECEICGVEVGYHQHPIIGLQWMLTVFRNGLAPEQAQKFAQMPIGDLLDRRLEDLIDAPFSQELHRTMQSVIASGTMLVGVKKGTITGADFADAINRGKDLAKAFLPQTKTSSPPMAAPDPEVTSQPGGLALMRLRIRYVFSLPSGQRIAFLFRAVQRRIQGTRRD